VIKGRFWVFHSPPVKAVVARFERSKGHEVLLEYFPPEWAGDIQGDGATAYDAFVGKRPQVRVAGCMAHARRRWFDAAEAAVTPSATSCSTLDSSTGWSARRVSSG